MGGRKQKKKLNLNWATKEPSVASNHSSPARNLRKTDLGAVIFGCTHITINECFSNQLFGLPEGHYSYIKNISKGLVLFLFNYSDRKLHGIFEAAGPGQMNINQYAWVADGDDTVYTRFPAQVRIRVRQVCEPLSENQFGTVIADNYYENRLFHFELDHDQKNKLISLFKPMLPNSSVATKWNNLYGSLPVNPKREENNAIRSRQSEVGFDHASLPPDEGRQALTKNPNQTSKISYASVLGTTTTTASSSHPPGKWRALFKTESDIKTANDDQTNIQASNVSFSDSEVYGNKVDFLQENTWEESQRNATTTDEVTCGQTWEEYSSSQADSTGDKLPLNIEYGENTWEESQLIAPEITCGQAQEDGLGPQANTTTDEWLLNQEYEDNSNLLQANPWEETHVIPNTTAEAKCDQTWVSDLKSLVNTVIDEVEQVQSSDLSGQHLSKPSSSSQPLNDNLDCSLSSHVKTSESGKEEYNEKDNVSVLNTAAEMSSTIAVAETSTDLQPLVAKLMQEVEVMKGSQLKQIVKINMLEKELVDSKQEIQQLRDRLSYLESGSRSVVEPGEMSKSPSKFAESVFIVGGYDGSSWLTTLDSYFPSHDIKIPCCPMKFVKPYPSAAILDGEIYHFGGGESHKVESFNPTKNQWILRPNSYWKNMHVAAGSVKERLFVVGGAKGRQCSSEVEYLDLNIGKWLPTRSMQSKRLAPAAAELNNALYVAGGYDGVSYLSSVERFDPREEIWYKLPNMNANKGCHTMVVLNEKLYTLGGFNGKKYVPTVECFDTRMGVWVEAQPMNVARGNFGAFVWGEKLYAIGGTKENEEILDIVECYKEGSGWEVAANLEGIGKRSHFSAIIM